MYVATIRGMHLNLHMTRDMQLEVKIFQQQWDSFGRAESNLNILDHAAFQPTFRSGDKVIWLNPDPDKTATYTAEELTAHLVELFAEHIQESGSE
jgi:hypothetical protein